MSSRTSDHSTNVHNQKKDAGDHNVSDEIGEQFYDDGTRSFFWRAHTVTVLFLISSVLLYVSLYDQPGDTMYNMRRGILAVVIVFILIGVIHMPDGPFIRPHPAVWRFALCIMIMYILLLAVCILPAAVWRFALCIMIVYILLLLFTLFQNVDDARQFLKYYDPELGVPLPERTYAEDCRIYTPENPEGSFANVMDKMDVFVPAHFLGWYLKALIIRDVWLLNVISIGFELMEYTLECQLPNFGECWWDHWILDFLLCNGLGIYLGIKTCEYLSMKTYHWRGLWKIPTFKGKLKRAAEQFTPYSWEQFKWGYTESFTKFISVAALITFWMLQELNVFYLKTILWVPPHHSLNAYRELIYAVCGACAISEMYHFLQSKDPNARVGRFSWLVFAALIIETLIEIKFGWDILTIPLPRIAIILWSIFFLGVFIWATYIFTYPLKEFPIIRNYFKQSQKKSN